MVPFIFTNLNETIVQKVIDLDSKFYSNENFVDIPSTLNRLKINHETDIVAIENDEVMGYITLIPISKTVFSKINNHEMNETDIENSVIPFDYIGKYYFYLSSIIINKEKFPFFKSSFLMNELNLLLKKFKKRGIFVEKIIAKAVTRSGEKFLENYGFKKTNSDIFNLKISNIETVFIRNIKNPFVIEDFKNKILSLSTKKTLYNGNIFDYRDADT